MMLHMPPYASICLRGHAVVTCAEWRLALSEIDTEFLRKVVILTAAYVSPKFQHKPPHQWYLHIYAAHPCRGHWGTLIALQRLVFALFVGNSLDGIFHLWPVESDVRFSQKQAETWTRMAQKRFHCLSVHLRWLQILWTVDGEIPKFFAILWWETLSLNNFLTQFGTKWWTTTHPCVQRLSLWCMFILYSILKTSPITS